MGSVPENSRLEIKFAGYEVNYDTIVHWLGIHRLRFARPHPSRWVNNVYFDTHGLAAFSENLTGASARTKVRYRWYGRDTGPAGGVLEIKCKRNYFGWKRRYKVVEAPYRHGASWRSVRGEMIRQLPPEGRRWLEANPVPVLINRYHREYFVTVDERIRATIDTSQAVWDQRFKAAPNFAHQANLPRSLVVEFKFARNDRGLACDCLQGFPIRVSRHSKYINGVRAISDR